MVVIVGAVGLDGQHRARLHGPAVDVDGAGAALAGVAADVRAGQVEILAERLDEEPSGLDVELPVLAVDLERDVQLAHRGDLLSPVDNGGGDAWGCARRRGLSRCHAETG